MRRPSDAELLGLNQAGCNGSQTGDALDRNCKIKLSFYCKMYVLVYVNMCSITKHTVATAEQKLKISMVI